MRAHLSRVITDNQGNVVAGAVVRVLQPDTTTLITDTLWVDDTTTTQQAANPFTAGNGLVDLYCDTPIRVRLGVTPPGGVEIFFDNLDFSEALSGVNAFNSTTLEITPISPAVETGLILHDSTGARWKITVDTTGSLVIAAL